MITHIVHMWFHNSTSNLANICIVNSTQAVIDPGISVAEVDIYGTGCGVLKSTTHKSLSIIKSYI